MLQNLRLHPFTVIIYGEVNAAAAVHAGDLDEPLSVLIFDSMVYGIFHHRLKHQLDDLLLQDFFFHMDFKFHFILIPHLLYGQITPGIVNFPFYGHQFILVADALPKQPGQGRGHEHHLFCFPALRHPDNGIQGIVQKMRIDLGLQGLQLTQAFLFLLVSILFHKLPDTDNHDIKSFPQARNFVISFFLYPDSFKLSFFRFFHGILQSFQRTCDCRRENHAQQDCHHKKGRGYDNVQSLGFRAPPHQLRHIGNSNHTPAGFIRYGNRVQPSVFLIVCEEKAVFTFQHFIDQLCFQGAVNELLFGMVNDFSGGIDDINIIRADIVSFTQILQRFIIQINEKNSHDFPCIGVFQPPAHGDHPFIIIPDDILHMG